LPPDALRIVSAASVSLEAYAAVFTDAFRGYQHPITLDVAALSRRVRMQQYDLENSLLAFDGDEAVGMAALAVRGERGWVAGFGVVPSQRGRGRGRELMSALLGRARAAGLRRLSLEVLTGNDAARRLYEWAGMRVTRDLLLLDRPAGGAAGAARRPAPAREAPARELLAHYARLHPEPPAWQREPASLLTMALRGIYVGPRARPRAYALLASHPDGNTYLLDLAAADAAQAAAMCAALEAVPGTLKTVNEPEHSPFVAPLLRHGFAEVLRQHQMTMEL
jgi:GNAT superfamily N-acetyltransferase